MNNGEINMALRITRATDPLPVTQLTIVLYALPGLGKTSTAFTAESPILLDFDHGAYRSQFRKDTVQINKWSDVESIEASDLEPFKTVVVDTAGRALDCLAADIIRKNPKMKGFGGALSLQGYGALKSAFISWLSLLHSFGKDVILIAHADEQRSGDDIVERLDVQGGSKNEIYKVADAMGRIRTQDGGTILDFSPRENGFGKNPAQLPVIQIPDFRKEPAFFSGVVAQIKDALNAQSEAGMKAQAEIDEARAWFSSLDTADDFNGVIEQIKERTPTIKALLVAEAKKKGFDFDKKAITFKLKEAA
jgi:hypothetical protein